MYCGTPVVATKTGALSDAPEQTFWECTTSNIAEVVTCLLENPGEATRRARLAQKWVWTHHSRERAAEQHLMLYRECLATHKP
jgi:glycosyltransferase involved in cell wall biosynthesis